MATFIQNLPHLIMAVVVVAAMTVLAALNVITGGEALGVIGAATGFSLGVGGTSTSLSVAAATTPLASASTGRRKTDTTPVLVAEQQTPQTAA